MSCRCAGLGRVAGTGGGWADSALGAASPGAASGKLVFSSTTAQAMAAQDESCILVKRETTPEDVRGMHAARGIVTARGGMTSHAAVVARGMGRPCVSGAGEIQIYEAKGEFRARGRVFKAGDIITIDGSKGEVLAGTVKMIEPELSGDFATLMTWADQVRRLKVRANAETPLDARTARQFGAEGIGRALKEAGAERRIVFMGDSITQNWGLSEPAYFTHGIINRGISGQTTPQMLARFRSDVVALKPKAVHIMAGINDIAGNTGPVTLADIEGNLASMVEIAQANHVRVVLATVLPAAVFNWAPALKPGPEVQKLNTWIRAYAAEHQLILADYYPAMAMPDGAMRPELTLDGVHPNKAGYRAMAPITQAAVEAALR